jgi:hypothetical protein
MRKWVIAAAVVSSSALSAVLSALGYLEYSIPVLAISAASYAVLIKGRNARSDGDVMEFLSNMCSTSPSSPLQSRVESSLRERFWFRRYMLEAMRLCGLSEHPKNAFSGLVSHGGLLGRTASVLADSMEKGKDPSPALRMLHDSSYARSKAQAGMRSSLRNSLSICAMSSCAFFPAFAGIGVTIISFAGGLSSAALPVGYASIAMMSYVALSMLAYSLAERGEYGNARMSLLMALSLAVFRASFMLSSHYAL